VRKHTIAVLRAPCVVFAVVAMHGYISMHFRRSRLCLVCLQTGAMQLARCLPFTSAFQTLPASWSHPYNTDCIVIVFFQRWRRVIATQTHTGHRLCNINSKNKHEASAGINEANQSWLYPAQHKPRHPTPKASTHAPSRAQIQASLAD
jgi:hypothetical protein